MAPGSQGPELVSPPPHSGVNFPGFWGASLAHIMSLGIADRDLMLHDQEGPWAPSNTLLPDMYLCYYQNLPEGSQPQVRHVHTLLPGMC